MEVLKIERTASDLQHLDINNSKSSEPELQNITSFSQASAAGNDCRSGEEVVLHKLSRINGEINKMTKEQLQIELQALGLNTGGVKEILKKRLKNYHRRLRMCQSNKLQDAEKNQQFDYLVVIDYEATCEQNNYNYVHEIIEFPAVAIDVQNCSKTNVFQKYCKPKINRRLTEFCKDLTGISQAQVDHAQDFTEVLQEFQEWLQNQGLGTKHKFAVVTDGPWDMSRFLQKQVELSGVKFPNWAKHWINLRKTYASFYNTRRVTLNQMLEELGLTFQGRPHCGLDDSHNISNIALCLLNDGCIFKHNEHLHEFNQNHQTPYKSSSSTPGSNKSCKSTSRRKGRFPAGEEVVQDGENVADLLLYAKLQQT